MRDIAFAVTTFVAVIYSVFVLPTGHLDPCRALMARTLHDLPPPTGSYFVDLAARIVVDDLQRQLDSNGPIRCTVALAQRAVGGPITVIH